MLIGTKHHKEDFTWIDPSNPSYEEGTIISPFTTREVEEKGPSNLSRVSHYWRLGSNPESQTRELRLGHLLSCVKCNHGAEGRGDFGVRIVISLLTL